MTRIMTGNIDTQHKYFRSVCIETDMMTLTLLSLSICHLKVKVRTLAQLLLLYDEFLQITQRNVETVKC